MADLVGGLAGGLAGLKVIDLTRVLGGPYCTMILSDHGADVVKLEPPQGDEVREWGPPFLERPDGSRDASYFLGVNRNKRSLALDLTTERGREVLLRLLESADVLVENFKPGTLERWGLGYDAVLKERFPRLIHCRISGFGADGPLGGLPGYDAIVQGMTGLMSTNGAPETGPIRIGTPLVDLGTGLYATIGILIALHERETSGLGQFIDTCLYDCGLALLHPSAANWFLGAPRPKPMGSRHPNIAPYETYMTATGLIFLAIGNDDQFRRLCALLDLPDLIKDPRFLTNALRLQNRQPLIDTLAAKFAPTNGTEICEKLLRAGLPAGPVLAVDEAVQAPHTLHREMVVDVEGVTTLGTPVKLSRTPGGPRRAPAAFAADAQAVLADYGFSDEEISALVEAQVLPTRRAGSRK